MNTLLLIHAFAAAYVTGVLWFLQLAHYPLFDEIGRDRFVSYEIRHQRRTVWVSIPVVLVELLVACLIVLESAGTSNFALAVAGAVLLLAGWAAGVTIASLHEKLETGFDEVVWKKLLKRNWIRTIAWTLRVLVAFQLLHQQLNEPL